MNRPPALNPGVSLQDLAAASVSVILSIGLVALSLLEKEVPASLAYALGSSTTWLFVRTVQRAATNGYPPERDP